MKNLENQYIKLEKETEKVLKSLEKSNQKNQEIEKENHENYSI